MRTWSTLVTLAMLRISERGAHLLKSCAERVQQWAAENALETETARAMAIGKLRSKAKAAGANAVLAIAMDCENEQAPMGLGGGVNAQVGMTVMIASGTAVLLGGDLSGLVPPPDDKHCLYAGVYAQVPIVAATVAATPLEMDRGADGRIARA